MDQSDIKYVLELLNDAILNQDWDVVIEIRETMKEFLDEYNDDSDEPDI